MIRLSLLVAPGLACGLLLAGCATSPPPPVQAAAPVAAPAVPPLPPGVSPTGNLIGLSTDNGRIAYAFVDLWFNQHMPERAFDLYVSRDHYMNHSVNKASDKQTFEGEKAAEARATSGASHFDIEQVIAQGDLVVLHIHTLPHAQPMPPRPTGTAAGHWGAATAGDRRGRTQDGDPKMGRELVILLRIQGGKVVDHWDLHTGMVTDAATFAGMDRFDH